MAKKSMIPYLDQIAQANIFIFAHILTTELQSNNDLLNFKANIDPMALLSQAEPS